MDPRTQRIRALNDELRQDFGCGIAVMTPQRTSPSCLSSQGRVRRVLGRCPAGGVPNSLDVGSGNREVVISDCSQLQTPPSSLRTASSRPAGADRPRRGDALRCRDDGIGVYAVVPMEVVKGVQSAQSARLRRACTSPRSRARCAAVQPALSRSADVTARRPTSRRSSAINPMAWNCFRRNRAGVSDHDLAVRPRFAKPVSAVNHRLAQLRRHHALDLFHRTGRQAQIDRAAGFVTQPVAFGCRAVTIHLDVVERKPEDDGELVDERGLESGKPVLRHSD